MFSQVAVTHSVHNRPHGYSVTVHPSYCAVGMHPTGMLSCLVMILSSQRYNTFQNYVRKPELPIIFVEKDVYPLHTGNRLSIQEIHL